MTSDVITQVRDYLDAISTSVAVEEVVTHPAAPSKRPIRKWRGPLVALATAVVVVVVVATVALVREDNQPPAGPFTVVEEVIGGEVAGSYYAVGFDRDGLLCAETGAAHISQTACGPGDRLTGMAFQGESSVALAGWAPTSIGNLTAVYNGELRRPLELTLIPERDLYVFGAIETIQVRFVEIEVTDENGEIIERYFPSLGPETD